SQMPPEPSVTSASLGPRLCTLRYSSALLPNSFERPGPKSVSPARNCSGVEVVVWWRWIVDIRAPWRRPSGRLKMATVVAGFIVAANPVTVGRRRARQVGHQRLTRSFAPLTVQAVREGGNGDNLPLVESRQRRVDHVTGRHDNFRWEVFDRLAGGLPEVRRRRARQDDLDANTRAGQLVLERLA